MVNMIKKRIQQKKDSLAVMRSYLEDKIRNENYTAIDAGASEIKIIKASIEELEWILSIIQQMGKSK